MKTSPNWLHPGCTRAGGYDLPSPLLAQHFALPPDPVEIWCAHCGHDFVAEPVERGGWIHCPACAARIQMFREVAA